MPQPLNSKDGASFRQLVKLYEAKQHKKAIKTADGILKKNPNHGDTMAMKALTLNAMGQTDEAFALAKQALQADMKSHICWHVYGLLYRSTKQLDEAIKAYKFALKLEPESQQIQRDLAFLQIQMRDYAGYIESRKAILQQRSGLRQNWTALAVAHHLAGNLATAEKLLKTYEDTLKQPPPRTDYEHSEAALYRNTIIAEMGETQRALEHLESIAKNNLDRTAVMEMRAQYQLQLGMKKEAEASYRALLCRNNEYRTYYEKLEEAMGLDRKTDSKKVAELYEKFAEQNERVDAPLRIPLDFLEGEEFKVAADRYLKRMLAKGVPSTFANIKALYTSADKLATIQDLVEGYTANLTLANGDATLANGDKSTRFEQACYYFLAHHYDYFRSRDLKKAMDYVEKAISLDPKSVFYTMTKARIIKHTGDLVKAAEVMNQARELDEKDRYINTKCAKYQLRRDDNEAAIATMSKFTRNETVGGALGDLLDMQCMWYITEDGESYLRQGKLSLALKRFKAIYDIFDVWQEDQFDFHQFSIRKGQIRAYVEMMRWEDKLREHPFYTRAALQAIKIYVMLHDNPDLANTGLANGVNLEGLDPKEKQKALKKAKKEAEKKAQEEAEKREAANKGKKPGTGADGEPKKEDPDPQGLKLLETKAPLDEAVKYLQPLLELSPKNIDGQNAGFEVYLRRKRYLLALRCLIAAHALDAEQATLHEQLVRFRQALDADSESKSAKADQVLKANLSIVPETKDLKSFNNAYMAKHKDCARKTRAGLRVRQLLDPSSKAQNEKDLIALVEKADMKEAIEGLETLKQWNSDAKVKEDYISKAKAKWPQASTFK
ncbi:uncharacterized protein PV09_02514 [Verruconis gallopava]|uniref:Uncharacterized protein n=1 Tax=Verruconis gallopava TaxID=253628 RepID=A0A0D2B6H0_9PEZI|nr:uncharacterized protein PV09_02514 [Verruconis gallopava]KIW06834.1 hypothetical protein PV09_02514 [Verruconis gallopava]